MLYYIFHLPAIYQSQGDYNILEIANFPDFIENGNEAIK